MIETKIEKFKIVLKLIKNLQIHSIKMRFYFESKFSPEDLSNYFWLEYEN